MKKNTTSIAIALLGVLGNFSISHGQETDPFTKRDDPSSSKTQMKKDEVVGSNYSLCYEVFSLSLTDAAKMRREGINEAELYRRLTTMLEEGKSKQESFVTMKVMSGIRVTSKSGSEHIYPTEFDPPELPNMLGVGVPVVGGESPTLPKAKELIDAPAIARIEGVSTPANPTSYETRILGINLEAELTVEAGGSGKKSALLRFASEHVRLGGSIEAGQGLAKTELPRFESQGIQLTVNIGLNQPLLLGTLNQPIDSKLDPDSGQKVWYAFAHLSSVNR